MLSVCDYQWKRAITRVNLILEAKCPTGWRIANFSSFPAILCKPCHSPHLSMSAAISNADACTFSIRASLTRASTSDRCQCCRRRSWWDLQDLQEFAPFFSLPLPNHVSAKCPKPLFSVSVAVPLTSLATGNKEIETVFNMPNFQNDLLQLLSVRNKRMPWEKLKVYLN